MGDSPNTTQSFNPVTKRDVFALEGLCLALLIKMRRREALLQLMFFIHFKIVVHI